MKQLLSSISSIVIFIGLISLTGCSQNKEIKVITFETTLGPIVIELFEEEAPIVGSNIKEDKIGKFIILQLEKLTKLKSLITL